ncbi:pyridoxamine 5'-phosphate oxidase family protein [Magnetovibrio sp.]|uniref:pyridoxamine 5'-phosphate oxidase family protein n=1 Tax=Magnetovibrio sp. TaxID=2024836 RepID=UPI002F9353C0
MATFYDAITDKQRDLIGRQHLFFVATAPDQGRVNLSPKGMDSFRILGPNQVAYLDLTGSGNETSAHLRQNGRITVMFCAFQGTPRIVRLFGRGRVVTQTDAAWAELSALFPKHPGSRQIMIIDVEQTQDSCGTGVPLYDYKGDRDALVNEWAKRGPDGVRTYWQERNHTSIDGLKPYPLDD